MTIGIYKITNQSNGKTYIGQSINITDRIYKHKISLKGNYHKNDHLQKAWNKYGENSFKFEIIKECATKDLDNWEKWYISIYNSTNNDFGYNNESGGNLQKKISQSTIKKMTASRESVTKEKNPCWKDYPRIVKAGKSKGKQTYGIRYNGKMICRSVNLELLQEKLENEDFTPTIKEEPHIVKGGFDENGNQMYRICKNSTLICSSNDLELLKEKLKNNDFSPIPNSKPPRIIKTGFINGKQTYAIYKNGEYLKRSNNLKKLEKILEEMIKQ